MGDDSVAPPTRDESIALLAGVLRPSLADAADSAATALIAEFGSLGALVSPASHYRVRRIAGDAAGDQLVACSKLLWAALRARCEGSPILADSGKVEDYLRLTLSFQKIEQVRALYMNARHELMADELIASGELSGAIPGIRHVLGRALEIGASGLIVAHNHPSGDPAPSATDIAYTRQLRDAARLLDIALHDHLVVARGRFISMHRAGLM